MKTMMKFRSRLSFLFISCLLLIPTISASPSGAAQQGPFEDGQMVADLTAGLQLAPEQVAKLKDLIDERRPRFEGLVRQMSQSPPNTPGFNEARGQIEREQRALLEAFLPSLNPEQQTRLRGFINNMPGNRPSPVAPVKPNLPSGSFAAGERLIALPVTGASTATRSRRVSSTPSLTDEQKILHLLNRAGFGPRPGDVERVRQMGIEQYIDQQLHPEELVDPLLARPLNQLGTLQMTQFEILQNFEPPPVMPQPAPTPTPAPTQPPPIKSLVTPGSDQKKAETDRPADSMQMQQQGAMPQQTMPQPPQPQTQPPRPPGPPRDPQLPLRELQQARMLRAVFSERQLQEVMVDFWFNHFNVFGQKDAARWLLTSYERDAIRPHTLGKFKDLLVAVAQSPAMLIYLDNFMSQAEMPPPPQRLDADGNPLPQPRRPGLNENYARELMELHTLGVDGGYTQQDVIEVARCLTGWTIGPRGNMSFAFRPRTHDKGEKTVLGKRIPAGGGIEDGLRVLEILANHPSTAKFISRKLVQRFVADAPPEPLVEHAASVFTKTGGDIREVVRAILTSPEFYSPRHYRTKIKSPLEVVASAVRATGASTDGAQPLVQTIARMGGPLYLCQPPTGYDEDSSQWLSNATLLERMNFGVALASNRINGTRVDVSRFVSTEAAGDHNRLIDQLVAVLVHSDVAAGTRANLARVINESRAKTTPAKFDERSAKRNTELASGLAALILGSREFQVK